MSGLASRENGKKGGRPKGYAAIQAEKSRKIICEQLEKEWTPIVIKAIEQAKSGDNNARTWLSDRGYGKVAQAIVTQDEEGNDIPLRDVSKMSEEEIDEYLKSKLSGST